MSTVNVKFRPLTMHAGDKKTLRFTIADYDVDPTGNTPLDLTDFVGKWSLVRKLGGTYKAEPEVFETMTLFGPAVNGQLIVVLDEVDTEELEGSYQQQVRLYYTPDSNAPSVVGKGEVFIERTQEDS